MQVKVADDAKGWLKGKDDDDGYRVDQFAASARTSNLYKKKYVALYRVARSRYQERRTAAMDML